MADFPNALGLLDIPKVQVENPIDTQAKAQGLLLQQQTYRMNAMKMQQQQQDFQDEQDVRAAAQQSGGDVDKISQILRTRNPRAAAKYDQELAATRKAQAESDQLGLKNKIDTVDLLGRRAGEVQSQQDWDRLRNDPTFKDFTQGLNPQFDPGQRDQLVQSTMSAKDQAEAHAKAAQAQLDKAKVDEEVRKGNISQQESDLKKREADMSTAAHVMSQVTNQKDHDNALQYLKSAGVDPNVINLYGSVYTPDTPNKAKGYLNVGEKQSDREKAVAEFNTNPALTAKYGPGELGYQKYEQAQGIQKDVTLENMRIGAEAAARKDTQDITEQNRRQDKAEAAKGKVDQVYNDVLQSADNMRGFLQQAAAGNKVDNAAFKQMMVNEINKLSGIKRSNQGEMNNLGAAGSVVDRLQGKLAGWESGKSVPPDILSDSQQLFNMIQANAAKAKQRSYDTIDQHSGVKPAAGGALASPAVNTTMPKVGEVRRGYKYKGGDPANPNSWQKQ